MIGSTLLTLLVTAFPGQAPGKLAEVGTVVLVAPFDRSEDLKAWRDVGPDVRIVPGSSAACVRIERPVERGPGAAMIRTPLPIDAIRGCGVRCEAFIKAEDVAAPPHPWNGVKFMVHTVGVPDTWQQRD